MANTSFISRRKIAPLLHSAALLALLTFAPFQALSEENPEPALLCSFFSESEKNAAVDTQEDAGSFNQLSEALVDAFIEGEELHPLYSQSLPKLTRAPASPPMTPIDPDDLSHLVEVAPPEDRAPAAVKTRSTRQPKTKAAASTARRSRIPATINYGFEFRAQVDGVTTVFWVIKRADRYDLSYSNSSGSRSSIGLSVETFMQLHEMASKIKPINDKVNKCAKAVMQVHIVTPGRAERSLTACVKSKAKSAEELRRFAAILARFIW